MILEADSEDGRCFIMDLDRSEVSPPRTWLELIEKMNNGAYYLDLEEIRHDMVVVLPALSNVKGNTDEYGWANFFLLLVVEKVTNFFCF